MHLPRRRPRPFPGIELRISTINGPLVLADSEELYYAARYNGTGSYCTPVCLPACADHGWLNLVAGATATGDLPRQVPIEEYSTVPLKIEIRAVMLAGR